VRTPLMEARHHPDHERCASTLRFRHGNACAAQQVHELLGVGDRVVPVAVVQTRLSAALRKRSPLRAPPTDVLAVPGVPAVQARVPAVHRVEWTHEKAYPT
jgi:hypothetical protein